MKMKWIKGLLIGFVLLGSWSCSSEPDQNYKLFKPFMRVQKNASNESAGSFAREGFSIFGFSLIGEDGKINQGVDKVSSFVIMGPDGKEFENFQTSGSFGIRNSSGGSGYQIYGIQLKYAWWIGLDLIYDPKTPMPQGKYVYDVTLNNGKKIQHTITFEPLKEDPIIGYPEKIKFDLKTRKVKWNPTKGQTGYRVALYQGIKQGRLEPSKLLFSSDMLGHVIKDPAYVLPDSVVLEKGESYYIVVESIYSKSGMYSDSIYIHNQDNDDELAVFPVNKTTDKKEPLSLEDVNYTYPVKKIKANGYKIAYLDEGSGNPVVFVHGLSTDLNSFVMLFPQLIEKGYRVIALDLVGYGKSEKPEITHTIEIQTKTLIDFINQLKLKNLVLIGHSLGGAVTINSALKRPDLFSKLILLASGATYPHPDGAIEYFKANYDSQFSKRYSDLPAARVYFNESVAAWNNAMENFMILRERSMLHSDWKKVQKTIKNSSISYMIENNKLSAQIGKIQKPVLAIYADRDNTIRANFAQDYIREKAPKWQVEVLSNCGHMLQYEKKEKVLELILAFLKK